MSSQYGRKLNPQHRLRDPFGVKAIRQSVTLTNNPSTIDQCQPLLVRFPNLGAHDVLVPGTAWLSFTIGLNSTDASRELVWNIGRATVKKIAIKISGNEVLSIDDNDVYFCSMDLWRMAKEQENLKYQDICNQNTLRLRVGADSVDKTVVGDKAVADALV